MLRSRSLLSITLTATLALPVLAGSPAWANSHGGKPGGGSTTTTTGNDISWPQCGSTFPTGQAFGVVGVNDGIANKLNPCFGTVNAGSSGSELAWALGSSGLSTQPKAQLYVNTGDPGNWYNNEPVGDWPTTGSSSTWGSCGKTTITYNGTTYTVGQDSAACAYQYGVQRANQDLSWVTSAVTGLGTAGVSSVPPATAYPWWLDVETGNSWMSDLTMNVATLDGMLDTLKSGGVNYVGVYSTSYQWGQIIGNNSLDAPLDDWIPGASSVSSAQSNCSLSAFTSGKVVMTQWTPHRGDDGDYSC